MGSTVTPGEPQVDATPEEHWTTDEDAIDTAGPTRTPNSPVAHQGPLSRQVPSDQARNAAAAVMRTNFPNMIAEMNPDWDPLTAHDLLHHSEDTSDSVELVTSEEEPTEEEHDSDSEERDGFPNIQRVVTYPARLTEDGGIERIGPTEVILRQTQLGTNGTKITGLLIALTRIAKSEHLQAQQLTFRYLCQQRTVGNGEDHVV